MGRGSGDTQEGKSGKKGAEKLAKEVNKIRLQIPIPQGTIVKQGSMDEVGLEHKLDGQVGFISTGWVRAFQVSRVTQIHARAHNISKKREFGRDRELPCY